MRTRPCCTTLQLPLGRLAAASSGRLRRGRVLRGAAQRRRCDLGSTGASVPESLVVATMYEPSNGTFLDRIRMHFKSPLKIKKQKLFAEHELFSPEDGSTIKEKYGTAERELKELAAAVSQRLGLSTKASEKTASRRKQESSNVRKGRGGSAGVSARTH